MRLGITFHMINQSSTDSIYVSIFLLLIAKINLRSKKGIGLLSGAWGYTSCIIFRAFIWRMEAIWVDELPNYETLQVKV